jgi:hypothetical protein
MTTLRCAVAVTAGLFVTLHVSAGNDYYNYGEWNAYGSGKARTVMYYGYSGGLESYGFEVTFDAVNAPGSEALKLNYGTDGIPFDHVELNFQAAGHPGGPGDTYWADPHFDFHFFTIDGAARDNITDEATSYVMPNASEIPTGYVMAPNSFEANEGSHWFNPAEFAGGPPFDFTASTIYGFYDGDMTFLEPMVAQDHMLSMSTDYDQTTQNDFLQEEVARADSLPTSGLWPGEWTMTYAELANTGPSTGSFTVLLGDLQASVVPGGSGIVALLGLTGITRRRRNRA